MIQSILSEKIAKSLSGIDFSASQTFPSAFGELLSQSVLLGGKRLRPLLLLLVSEHLGLPLEKMAPYAKLVEWIHAASLSHDDVVDQATSRRGLPSINSLEGNKRAVLAGDYLLGQVIRELVDLGNPQILSLSAVAIQQLAQGEWLQLKMIEEKKFTLSQLIQVAEWKTASLMSLCCGIPYLWSEKNDVNLALNFGKFIGVAFQQIDDCLDFSKSSLKDQWLDLKNGQLNFVLFHLTQSNPKLFESFFNGDFSPEYLSLNEIQDAVCKVKAMAHENLQNAINLLNQLPGAKSQELSTLCHLIENREN